MSMRYLHNVASLQIDPERCTGCGICTEVCPHRVLATENRKAVIRDLDACMECGACRRNCPTEAIAVQPGVGCAYAIFRGMLTGTAPECGCGCDTGNTNCC